MHAFVCFFRYFKLDFDKYFVYNLLVRSIMRSMSGDSCLSDEFEGYGRCLNDLPPSFH